MRTHRLFEAALVLAALPAAAGPSYRVIEIPAIPSQGYNNVFSADINNHGVVVGMLSRLPGYVPVRAFLWDGVHPTVDLGDLGVYEFAQAVGINDADQAIAITESGEVLVVSYDRNDRGNDRYYIWKNGRIDQIGRLASYPGGPSAFAYSMNDSRQIVGAAIFPDGQQRAFLWENGKITDLGLAPGDDFFSGASKITNSGLIVGESWAFDDQNGHGSRAQGVVWQGGTFVRTIPPLPGDWALSALGANASGTIVGYSGYPSSAFVSLGGAASNLNDLVPGGNPRDRWLYQGRDVNDLGQIVVDGQFGCCGYLAQPWP